MRLSMSSLESISLCTWNVNSLKVRFEQLKALLASQNWDVVCLQETKMPDDKFPYEAFKEVGYHAFHAGQPTYNGVAILCRMNRFESIELVHAALPDREDPQQRFLMAKLDELYVASAYFPNGQSVESDKYRYKLQWIDDLIQCLVQYGYGQQDFALLGDFNIAPDDADVHDPAQWHEQILCSAEERKRFSRLIALDLSDAFRALHPGERQFTWWDYRQLAFQKNKGLRIDHALISKTLLSRLQSCEILRQIRKSEKASDHAPLVIKLASLPTTDHLPN